MSRRSRRSQIAALALAAAAVWAAPAHAHGDPEDAILAGGLSGRAAAEEIKHHEAEHAATDRAVARFDRMPAGQRRTIRRRLLGQDPAGRRAARLAADPPADQIGRWTSAPFPSPDYGVHAVLLPGGRVLLFSMGSGHAVGPNAMGNNGQGPNNDGQAAVWDPALGEGAAAFKEVPPPSIPLDDPQHRPGSEAPRPAPLFCAGQVQMADGRVLIAGGNLEASGGGFGMKMLFLFDPSTDSWVREPDMLNARWYPTLTRLPSGRIAILGGRDASGGDVASMELYPSDGSLIPGIDAGAAGQTGSRTTPTAARDVGMYPHAVVLPSGRLATSTWGAGPMGLFEPTTGRWVNRTNVALAVRGSYPTEFPLPGDQNGTTQMEMVGGTVRTTFFGDQLTGAAWAITPEVDGAWRAQPALNIPRRNSTAILLPDGSAVAVAGGLAELRFPLTGGQLSPNIQQKRIELWNPSTGAWTLGPPEATPRGYHSTALLLPDGRVMSGGDDFTSTVLDTNRSDRLDSTIEIYSPPYLFRGARPTIDAAPAAAGYGETITVRASGDRPITRATLVAPGSVTHAVDMNQRLLSLPMVANGDGTFTITGPTTSGAAPPGDYMLFVLNDLGVPSVASWVRIRPSFPGQGTPVLTPLPGDPGPATATAAPGPAPAPLDRAAVVTSLKTYFKKTAKQVDAGLKRLARACTAPKRSTSAAVTAARAEVLRKCRAKAMS